MVPCQPLVPRDSHVVDVSPSRLLQHLVCHLEARRELGMLWRGHPHQLQPALALAQN